MWDFQSLFVGVERLFLLRTVDHSEHLTGSVGGAHSC